MEDTQTAVAAAAVQASAHPPYEEWIEQFHRDGFLVVQNVLPADLIDELKNDIDTATEFSPKKADLALRMFERSRANVRLFDFEPIASFAEKLITSTRPGYDPDNVHVVHNNAIRTRPGQGLSGWHSDEPPHYLVTDGEPPTNVRLPVLLFTCNYYLTDVTELRHGPTQFVPGSHLIGRHCPDPIEGTEWEDRVVNAFGPAGTAVLFNCQVWHQGTVNVSDRVRYVAQVSYAHRIIGHRYYPFMNYVMPEHIYRDANPRLKRLLGFLPSGAYG